MPVTSHKTEKQNIRGQACCLEAQNLELLSQLSWYSMLFIQPPQILLGNLYIV